MTGRVYTIAGETYDLESWKDISAALGVTVRRCQQYEEQGMPVHRPRGDGAIVYARVAELRVWLATRKCAAGRDDGVCVGAVGVRKCAEGDR